MVKGKKEKRKTINKLSCQTHAETDFCHHKCVTQTCAFFQCGTSHAFLNKTTAKCPRFQNVMMFYKNDCYISFWQIFSKTLDAVCVYECSPSVSEFAALTDQWVCDVGPVDAVLQLQLVMWLDVEQQVLVETHAGDQVCTVCTLERAATVDVLQWKRKRSQDIRDMTRTKTTYRTYGANCSLYLDWNTEIFMYTNDKQ